MLILLVVTYAKRNLTFTTKQCSWVGCLAQISFDAGFHQFHCPTWTGFWEGIQWAAWVQIWFLITRRWQVYQMVRLTRKVVRFHHIWGTHWWDTPLYQKRRNWTRLNSPTVARPWKRLGVDLLCSAVARRWVRQSSADECTGCSEWAWLGSTVGNCCRLLSIGIRLLIASNLGVAWDLE